MILPIYTVRPEPGASATVTAGVAAGLRIRAAPLFDIRPCPWQAPSVDDVDALLFGSANALRHGGTQLAGFRGKPAYAVGEVTASLAAVAGFDVVRWGAGGLQALLEPMRGPLRLLRPAGANHVTLTPPDGVMVDTRVVYASTPVPLSEAVGGSLERGAVVLLHSAIAARHFAAECDRLRLPRSAIRLATFGPRISEAAGSGWNTLAAVAEPSEPGLLALAGKLCHALPRREEL